MYCIICTNFLEFIVVKLNNSSVQLFIQFAKKFFLIMICGLKQNI